MKTITGQQAINEGFRVFHVWGKAKDGEILSKFYATKDATGLLAKYNSEKRVYIDVASFNLKENYIVH